MANYYAKSRTSYTKVKDEEKFKEWVEEIKKAEIIKKEHKEHGTLYGLIFTDGFEVGAGIPVDVYNEEDYKYYEFDVMAEIQDHIAEGWAITFLEIGSEKHRYFVAYGAVVTPNQIVNLDLNEYVFEAIESLGNPKHTSCEY